MKVTPIRSTQIIGLHIDLIDDDAVNLRAALSQLEVYRRADPLHHGRDATGYKPWPWLDDLREKINY
jgi:hypothetical protein